jgi:glycosyltransferase involved in cell wall biosynthesis
MSRNGKPMVTVTVPMYNNERYIAETIESVLAQTMDDFELLIYDDHSTDRSLEIARSFDDRRIAVHFTL